MNARIEFPLRVEDGDEMNCKFLVVIGETVEESCDEESDFT